MGYSEREQAIVDAFKDELEKLRKENKRLKSVLSMNEKYLKYKDIRVISHF